MALSTLEHDLLAKSFATCKQILLDLHPKLLNFQQLYDSAGGVKETLLQSELDEVPELSGLQKTTVDDAMFVLTGAMLNAITSAYPSLSQMAARFV
jgi:hypothetical protein